MTPELSVLVAIVTCIAGALATLLVSRNTTLAGWVAFAVTLATALVIFSGAATVLSQGPSAHPATFWSLPMFGFA